MGRRSKNLPLPLQAQARVRLTDEERSRKGHELAVVGLAIRGHKRKLTSDNRATKAEIARLEKDRGDLEDALIADEELRPQGQLFVDGTATPTPGEAAAALADVARAAGEKPDGWAPHAFMPNDVGACEDCGYQAGDIVHAVAGEVKPSEPHAFIPTGDHGTARIMCQVCGAGVTDPIHDVLLTSAPVAAPPAETSKPGGNGKGRTHRTPGAQKARARARQGKAARA